MKSGADQLSKGKICKNFCSKNTGDRDTCDYLQESDYNVFLLRVCEVQI